jgi:hypothetical protein
MLIRFVKNAPAASTDALACVRPNGSTTQGDMARQGILPHEAFHFVVETELSWYDSFFGHVARGGSIGETHARFHDGQRAWTKNTQGMQSESLVECLQSEQWGGAADPAEFAEKLVMTCRRNGVVPPDITADELDRIRASLREFGAAWRPLTPGQTLERIFGS